MSEHNPGKEINPLKVFGFVALTAFLLTSMIWPAVSQMSKQAGDTITETSHAVPAVKANQTVAQAATPANRRYFATAGEHRFQVPQGVISVRLHLWSARRSAGKGSYAFVDMVPTEGEVMVVRIAENTGAGGVIQVADRELKQGEIVLWRESAGRDVLALPPEGRVRDVRPSSDMLVSVHRAGTPGYPQPRNPVTGRKAGPEAQAVAEWDPVQ